MQAEADPPGESPATTPASATAPPVTLLMVTHDPGAWFDDVLASIAALEYPNLDVLVVDAASSVPVAPHVAEVLPDARQVRLEENRGFGRSVNAALEAVDTARLLVLSHDDVLPEPMAVRSLVEEAFRSNASVVGPKLVDWDDPTRLLAAGEGADKFGFPVPYVERGELDQEQHDAVRDVFTVPDAFTLVRTDLLEAIGGFDEAGSWFGDDLDLCWRAHAAGGRVLVAPASRVRHREALGERRPVDDRRRHQFRHRMRVMLGAYGRLSLVRLLPQLAIVHLVEALFALVTGRPGQSRDVLSAWTWNAARLGSLRRRRAVLRGVRRIPDSEIRPLQVRGSARVAAFLRGQLATGGDPYGSAATLGRRLVDAVAGEGRRAALLAWLSVVAVLLLGSRHLITRPIPAIGELVPLPEQITPILSEWASSWRRAGTGGEGFAASADALAGGGVALLLGAAGLLRTLLVLGMLPLGLLGVWRLVAPAHSVRASVVALFAYVAVPLGYDSLATGSWRGLLAYGLMPWVVARVLRASGRVPFGAADPPAGPRIEVPPRWRQALALGILLALAAAIDPIWVVVPLLLVVAMVPGSIVVGQVGGLLRMGAVSVGAGLVAVVLHAPWAVELLGPGLDWATFTGGRTDAYPLRPVAEVLRFDTGPIGSSLVNAAVLVAGAYVLFVGRGWRLVWATRAWSVALVSWGLVWASGRGWLPVALPPEELVLAPAGAAMALATGLGAAAFDFDVRQRRFSWRQFASLLAVAALALSFVPVLAASIGGRWLMPRGDHHQLLSFLDREAASDDFRVLWLGHPDALPLGAWPLGPDVPGTAYATTQDGTPVFQDRWPGNPEPDGAPLAQTLDLALNLETTRLGRVLASMGIRYVVVVDQGAPAPYGGVRRPTPPIVVDAMEQQLDLERLDLNRAVTVYRNAAWAPMMSVLPTGTVPADVSGVRDGLRRSAGLDLAALSEPLGMSGPSSASGEIPAGTEVLIGSGPSEGWDLDIEGGATSTRAALGWTAIAPTDAGGTVGVSWSTPLVHRAALAAQLVAVLVIVAVMYATRAERRELRRRGEPRRHAARRAVEGEPHGDELSRRERRAVARRRGRRARR